MSRPKHYWYGSVRKMIMCREVLKDENSIQASIFTKAIKDATEETLKLPNGELRIKAVEEVLIYKTKTIDGVALEVSYSWRTVQNWINSFINLTGKKAGF